MIKKFNNGNIVIDLREDIESGYYDKNIINSIEDIYNNEVTMSDLYFNQINGYMYLVDYNTNNVYDFSDCYINILQYLASELMGNNYKIKLFPIKKKEAKQILIDLENGY